MRNSKTLAPTLIVMGAILLVFAYQSSQSLGDQLAEAFTGRFTDATSWLLILGVGSMAIGAGMLLFNRPAGA